ncbi:BTAD domain-containing putative transcriptional regulator [Evansella tamaricis]|uniref:Transcriptional regulator n=1 Tax=Evansella tamaricis TaxID=2069301 RepID=A0ABS6JLS8_9BACI|nr:BTAD domain-containing putative transcriptional regulator [Evansella tamaricis]MBU9714345.1 transcriptional regulator [Evansella tamaricis]
MERNGHFVLKTKLEPPMVDNQVLFRPTVMKRLRKAKDAPLTLVHGGPGFGKSTALSAFLRTGSYPFVWYTVTEQDDHLAPFLIYLKEAMCSMVPDIKEEWLTEAFMNIQRGDTRAIYECCSHFINACVGLDKDWLLIIDDFQLVSENEEISQFMKWFLMHLPQRLHVILISRSKLEWDFLATWRVKGQLVEVNERDLCFKEEEIQILFEDHYEMAITEEDARFLFLQTEGWIMAIQMVWQRLQEDSTLEEIFQDQATSMEELFEYLALDVLNKQPKDVYEFLLKSSIFQSFTVWGCQEVLHEPSCEKHITHLMKKHLFLHTTEKKEAYRYHALFRDFLQSRLKKWEPDILESLHERAVSHYEKRGMLDQALYHAEQCETIEKLAVFLHENGKEMIRQGKFQRLEICLGKIPVRAKDRYPYLWVVQGDFERYRSRYEAAITHYDRAREIGEERGDPICESKALEGAASVYLDTIQPRHAQDLLKKAIELLERVEKENHGAVLKEELQKQLRHLYVLMSENTINLGDAVEAKRWFEKSRALEPEEIEDDLEARLHLRTGRLSEMVRRLERRKRQKGMESVPGQTVLGPPKSHRETDLLLSYVYSLIGRGTEAKDAASAAIMQGVQAKAPFVEACGWMRMGHAIQLQDKYEQRLASTCYQTSLKMMEEMNISRGKAEPYMGLSLLYGKRRELEAAIKFADLGLKETDKVDDRWLSSWLRLCKGIAYCYSHNDGKALQEFERCHDQFLLCGDSYGLTVTTLWQSFITYRMGEEKRFYIYVRHFLQLMEKEGYHDLLKKPTLFGPVDVQQLSPMLLEAYHQRKKDHPFLHHLMLQLGMEEGRTNHPGFTLRIQTFREFKVFRGEEEILERDWKRGKAKELLQLFITKRKHLLQKEEIFELLWGGQDEEVAGRDFKVALNTLNKVLEPDRKARSTPFFIQRHERAYGLNLASPFDLDAAEFEHGITKGMETKDNGEAVHLLKQSLDLYEGDYLPERMHEDWCTEERERLQVLYLRGAERLSELYMLNEMWDLCIEAAERILEKDRCWEEAYRILMTAYHRKQNRKMVFYYYNKCREVLMEELGVPPMEKTEQLFEQLGVERSDVSDRSGA